MRRYRGADYSPLGTLRLGDDADNIRVDDQINQVVIGYGSGALAFLDAALGKKSGEIRPAAHPESFRLEPNGSRIFVNVPGARQIVVVDRATGKQVGKWGLPGAGANFPMGSRTPAGDFWWSIAIWPN